MVETKMWGERGLVATLCVDLGADPHDQGRWADLLKTAFLPTGLSFDWSRLDEVTAIVEPNFGSTHGFGSPDFVARLGFSDETVAVVFAEAKCVTYAEASRDPVGRDRKGYNSRINGQIELNHRLAVALQHSRDQRHLFEPAWVNGTCYIQGDKRRSVKQHGVLTELVPLLNDPESLLYLHLAITNDDQNPLEGGHPMAFMPVILDDDGGDVWHHARHRFGWINWAKIRAMAEGWNHSMFLDTYTLNEHFIQPEPIPPAGTDAAPAPVPDWPVGRPGSGVSLVRIPSIDAGTALHFSWNRQRCAVRNYIHPNAETDPNHPRYQPVQAVFGRISREQRCGRSRPRCEDTERWVELIEGLNREWGLP